MVIAQNSGDDRGLQENPPRSPPTYHHEQHCDCSGVIQVTGHHHLPGPELGQSHRLHCEKGPAEAVLPSPAQSVLCTSIIVWFSSATQSDLRINEG